MSTQNANGIPFTIPCDASGNPIGVAAVLDRELVVSTYFCKTAFTGASVNDTITSTQIIDVSGAPTTISVIWRNQTTAADLSGAPSAANLTLVGSTALTDAALRASAVPVIQQNLTATGSLATLASTLGVATGALATVGVQITGSGAGFTLTPQASMDGGATWITVGVVQAGAGAVSTPMTTITANGNWEFAAGGYTNFQLVNSVGASSGTVTANLLATNAPKFVRSVAIGDQADTAASTDTGTFSVLALVKRGLQNWTSLLAKLPASLGIKTAANSMSIAPASDAAFALGASETHLGNVSGSTVMVNATFGRPANTTAYAALQVVANSTSAPTLLTFAAMSRVAAGAGYIVKARLVTDQSTNTARFRLHLYHTAPTAINDGSAFTSLYANRANKIGTIDFAACVTEGVGSTDAYSMNATARLGFVLAAASNTIYGMLETLDAFTPASAQNFFIELTSEQN